MQGRNKKPSRHKYGTVFESRSLILDLDQHFRLNTDPDPDPIRIQGFDDQKLNKIFSWKKMFLSKFAIYLSLRPP